MAIFTGKRVLIFGDSLSHPGSDSAPEVNEYAGPLNSSAPGAVLAGKLKAAGAAATRTDARVSRSAVNFWSREDYKKLIEADVAWRPDLVFVMLGTNDLHLNQQADAQAMAGIRDVFRQAGAEVWGIGPPAFAKAEDNRDAERVVDTMRTVFGANRFIDARLLSADLVGGLARSSDGVHFKPAGAEVFADRMLHLISSQRTSMGLTTIGGLGLGVALFFSMLLLGVVWTRR